MAAPEDARPLSEAFGPFEGRIWLNAAHQGPLPVPARQAVADAVALKVAPAKLPDAAFWEVPLRLRQALARLLAASPDDIALTNSTSYGIDLVAHGLMLDEGDEVLLVEGDFPATVLPWMARHGPRVRFIEATRGRVSAELLEAALTPRTRVFCTSWVFSFYGTKLDLRALGEVCRRRDVLFVVNASQGIGSTPLAVATLAIDALSSCGFKWLCGPYATGFCWLSEPLRRRLSDPPPNWLRSAPADLNDELGYELPDDATASAYDVFCTANFLNFMPWQAAIEHLASLGIDRIAAHDQALVERLLAGLPAAYDLLSPRHGDERSTLVFISHRDPQRNRHVFSRLAEAGIDVALRAGEIRVSPHVYNSTADIDALLEVLADAT